jgi:hypothetical protein
MADERICFVISPIGGVGSDVRKRADQVLKHIVKPAVEACGYVAKRSDQISEPGIITSQVIQHVLNDPMVVADLTGSNGNVYYELALRHAIKKPFIQIISDDEKIPFDIINMRTVQFNYHDLDSAQEAREEIERQIKAVENNPPEEIESPITVALDFQALRQSANPEQRYLGEIFSAISAVRADMANLEKRIDSPSIKEREMLKWAEMQRMKLAQENTVLQQRRDDEIGSLSKQIEELKRKLHQPSPNT